jgi:hypothetical protein
MIMSNDLRHHGIKGMKWGIRRYQNKDGSLTPAGKKRYDESGEKKEKTVEDYKESLKKTQSADKALQGIKEIVNKADDVAYAKKVRNDLTQMSDKDLQQAVNRLNMEERYSQVMQQRHKIDRGESKVNQILDVAGNVLSGAATALSIAVAIKELTKK